MAEHDSITDPDIHEPKGVSAAAAGAVYVADGIGSGSWQISGIPGISGAAEDQVPLSDGAGSVTWGFPNRVETGWRDMLMPFTSATIPSVSAPDFTKVRDNGSGSTGVFAYLFDDSTIESLYLTFHVDHDFKVGTAWYPHVHWMPLTTGTGVVRWGIEWTYAPRTADPDSFGTTQFTYIEQAGAGVAYGHQVAEVADPGITLAGCEPDTVILARVFRDASHANDTYTGDVAGLFLDAHYQVDRYSTPNKAPDFYA
jgi:hypothetical protein